MNFKQVAITGKAKVKITFVLLFLVAIGYGILIGKYQFPPYKTISDIKIFMKENSGISTVEYLESLTPKGKEDKVEIIKKEKVISSNANIIEPVLKEILPIVYNSKKITPDFNVKLPSLIGFSKKFSAVQGENLTFYIHAENKVRANISWLGRKKTYIKSLGTLDPHIQSAKYSPIKGFEWTPSLNVDSKELKPGYYLLDLVSDEGDISYQIPFVVKSKNASRIAFIAGTNTWNAYNNYAGKSFYEDSQTIESVKEFNNALNVLLARNNSPILPVHIPFARPFSGPGPPAITDEYPEDPHQDHLIRGEWTLLAFAEEHSLNYGIFTDRDIFKNSKLFDSEIIVFNSHSEYWTKDMLSALREFISKGGKVVFAGGNNIYKEVRYTNYGVELIDSYSSEKINPIIGTYFVKQASPMFSSYEVKNKNHWVFQGTGVDNGSEFGKISANHRPEEKVTGASGWEADQTNEYSIGFEILAAGTNKFGGAHMVFKNTKSGGWVFNASSIPFTGALFIDKVVSKMMLNLLTHK